MTDNGREYKNSLDLSISISNVFYDAFAIISHLHNYILRETKEGRKKPQPRTYTTKQEEMEY